MAPVAAQPSAVFTTCEPSFSRTSGFDLLPSTFQANPAMNLVIFWILKS